MIYLLLSTYNGETYLSEQIDSLLQQTHQDWCLLVRDDGSTDGTLSLINRFASADPRIRLHEGAMTNVNLGAARSFGALLQAAYELGGEYFFFVDQDDVWHPDKVERSLAAMKIAEAKRPGAVLVHSDLRVVDASLNEIAPSFFRFMNLHPMPGGARTFRLLCIQNFITGCTMCVNRTAVEASIPMPQGVAMHDWWLALCVSAADGQIIFIDTPLMNYRQHGRNVIGAQGGYWKALNIFSKSFKSRFRNSSKFIDEIFSQLRAFAEHEKQGSFKSDYQHFALALLGILELPRFSPRRLLRIITLRPRRQDFARSVFLYRRLLISPSTKFSE